MVPNQQPKYTSQQYRLAVVGEAPGADEEATGSPFVGTSGRLLWSLAAKHGIMRESCFVGNVCQVRPPNNKIDLFHWNGSEIQSGIKQLEADLAVFKPNLIMCLGGTALRWAKNEIESITKWRGSLFRCHLGYKALAALHPAAVLREYSGLPLLNFDLRRARKEAETPTLVLPERNLRVNLTPAEILCELDQIKRDRPTISIDIEGGVTNMSCVSIARSEQNSFIIPFTTVFWQDLESRMWKSLADVLSDPSIPKVLQNSLYDLFVLQHAYSIPVRGLVDDTMLAHWELFCELPKSLGFQASVYTKEPYWKDEARSENDHDFYRYCCKDSSVTYEINDVLHKQLTGNALTHYRLNMALLEPLLYMELKGINYDKKKAQTKIRDLRDKTFRLQWALNEIAGIRTPTNVAGWVDILRDHLCFKREAANVVNLDTVLPHTKTTELHNAIRCVEILRQQTLSKSALGELATHTSIALNVESKTQMADFLYRQLGLPVQYKKEHGRLTDKETTDVLALLTLFKKTNDPTLKLILVVRGLRTRCETLEARTDSDGRIRCGYNIVGTETGRLSCYESPTGSGFNLQTVTKKDRDLFLPDPGYWMFQCDLSGADGWTVACHCKACGDPTMLADYLFGLKPARTIALIYQHGQDVLRWDRERLKSEGKKIDGDGWLYFACKRVQHGSNYGMKGRTMSDQILKDSFKLFGEPIFVEPDRCDHLQHLYFMRYPGVTSWHDRIKRMLKQTGKLTSASGHTRTFFGRRDDYDTFKQACAEEPQNNTTYAIKLALYRCWTDPENRIYQLPPENRESHSDRQKLSLQVQPLHTVHDSLNGQWRKEITEWACRKVREWFDNPLTIAGQTVVIPFEGSYGESWGNLKEGAI